MPEQVVIERGAHANEPFAVIDQQPDVELDAGQLRRPAGARRLPAAPRGRRRCASMRSTCRDRGRRGARRPSAASRPERRARHGRAGTAQMRPRHGGSPPAPRPARRPARAAQSSAAANPRSPTSIVCSPNSSPVLAPTAAMVCERLCMSAPSTIMTWSPFTSTESGRPADMACLGRCHAPIKSRRASRPATSDTAKASQADTADSVESESARRRSGASPRAPDVADSTIQTASVAGAAARRCVALLRSPCLHKSRSR